MSKEKIVRIGEFGSLIPYLSAFRDIYKDCFREAPYHEIFTDEEVNSIANELINNQGAILSLLLKEEKVIGLCGGYKMVCEREISSILQNKVSDINISNIFYLAELAVIKEYRKDGRGTKLVKRCMMEAKKEGNSYILMRTQHRNSNSQNLFVQQGLEVIDNMFQEVPTFINEDEGRMPTSQKRHFLIKKL